MASTERFDGLRWSPDDAPWLIGGLGAIALLLAGVAYALDTSALDAWTGLLVFLVLTMVSVPLFAWVGRKEQDPWFGRMLFWAFLAHMAFAMVRYYFIFVIYDGQGDAGIYHETGSIFARRLRDGEPVHPIAIIQNFPIETRRVGDVVGALYTVTGPSVYVGFLVFSYFCFWGQVLFVRGFKVAVPEGDYRRASILVLFFPSLLFWPSAIGKEALMIGCLGIIAYGGALLMAPKPMARGAAIFVVGVLLVMAIRPHVAYMSIGALALAMAVGALSNQKDATVAKAPAKSKGRMLRIVALVLLLTLAGSASTSLSGVLGESEESGLVDGQSGTAAALDQALRQTSIGNAEFEPVTITGPSRLPAGIASVLFRPFPWEASGANSMIAAMEGMVLMALVALSWRRLASFPFLAMRRPFLVFAVVFVVLFSIGFSFVGNFGILTRQRAQVMPSLLVLLALPKLPRRRITQRRRTFVEPAVSQPVGAGSVGSMQPSQVTVS